MKKFKHLFKLLIAIILFGQTSLTVFANENITSVSDINTTEEITEVESTINENEDVTAEIEEENSDELMSMSPYNSMAFATFDGQDLSEPTNTVSYNNLQSTRTTKSLDIKAEFSGSSSVTSRQIIVELKDGLAYDVLPGMNNSGAWIFDSSTLPVNLQGIIINGTWEKPAIVQGYQPKGGKIIYELAAGTTAVNISVGIISDIAFNIGTGKTIIDGIRVASFENGVKKNEEVLELYTLTEELIIMIDSVGTASRSYLSPGGSFTFTKRFRLRDSVTPHFYANALTKKIELTYKIDKNIQLTSITSNSQAHLPNSNILIETDASNATYNLVKVTLLETDANFVNLNYNVEAISTAVDGTYPLSLVGSSVTLLDDTVVANTLVRDFEVITVAISNSTDSTLTLTNLGDSSFSYDSNLVNEKNMPLGGFYFANKTPNTALNQKVKLEFTDTNIGVTTARIAFHKDANATDIIIKTTKGQAFTIATTQGLNVLGSNVWPVKTYAIDINSLGSIDSDEYIAEVIYNMGDVPSGEYSNGTALGLAQPYPATTYASPLTYFGNIISDTVPTQFSAKATIVSADKDFSDSSAVSATSIVNVNLAKNITFTGSYSSTKATVKGNEVATARIGFNKSNYRYSPYVASQVKGYEVFLRETEYLQIYGKTIAVSWNGNTYKEADGSLIVSTSIDNTGNTVYRLLLPDVVLGLKNDLTEYPSLNLTYDFKVKPSAPTTSIAANTLAQIQSLNGLEVTKSNGGNTLYNGPNTFDVDGSGDTNKYMGYPSDTQFLKIEAQKDFSVNTAANLNDGAWVSYDYKTNQTIIDLNPEGDAKYQLTVSNSSGQTIDGYSALIPVPKEGEQTDLTPATPDVFNSSEDIQKEAFSWTASIHEAIDTTNSSLDYEITYATVYDTDKDSTNFVAWESIANKDDIRMIRIKTTSPISDGTNDVIEFPLALTDPNADANAGKINIYSARIHRVVDGTAGYKPSEPVAIRLKTGVIKGNVFNDTNRDGLKASDEQGRNNVTVIAYETGTTNVIETVTTKTIDGIAGSFEFLGLDKNVPVDIVFINPVTDDSLRFSPVVVGGSTATANSDNSQAKTSNVIPSGPEFEDINVGFIAPYVISYNATGGNVVNSTVKKYPNETINVAEVATRDGYTFKGWSLTDGGTNVSYPYVVTDHVTFFALWEGNNQTVSFDVNGGDSIAPISQTVKTGDLLTSVAIPTKTGYTFKGWYTAATAGTKWDFVTMKMLPNDMTLYAQWTVNNYTITYNMNSGDGTIPSSQTITYNTAIGTLPTPTNTGHTFVGWNTQADGNGISYSATTLMPAADITLYAQWSINNYTITYDMNSGDGTVPSSQAITYNTTIGALPTSTNTGHTFVGWNTQADGNGDIYTDTTLMPATDVTLYAQWSINDYTITYDINGGDSTTPTSQIVTYNEVIGTLPSVTNTGHTFIGWNTQADGNGDIYTDTTLMPATDVTLYAQWTINDYTITYDMNGGDGTLPTSQTVTYNTAIGTLPSVTNTGTTFAGWNTQADGDGLVYTNTTLMPAANVTLYAQWTTNGYTITYDMNTGNGVVPTAKVVTYNTPIGILPTPTNTGHTFTGWNTQADGNGISYSATTLMPAADVTLYAQWSINDYAIIYDMNTGDGIVPNSQTVTYNIPIGVLPTPTNTGYTFIGWNTQADGNGTVYTDTTLMPATDVTLYAQWGINDYTITYDMNTGDGAAPINQVITYNETIGILPIPTNTGYTFVGWNTQADGKGTVYTDTTLMPATDVTLYAQWSINDYTITYDMNGGDGTVPTSQVVTYNETIGILPIATNTGYTFVGWNTQADGNGDIYTDTTLMPAVNVTLYAQWKKNSYSIELIASNFTVELKDVKNITGNEAQYLANIKEFDFYGTLLLQSDIKNLVNIDITQLNTIRSTKITGVYPLTYSISTQNISSTKTIQVSVINSLTSNDFVLETTDATITFEDLKTWIDNDTLNQNLLDVTNAKAYYLATGEEVAATFEVDTTNLQKVFTQTTQTQINILATIDGGEIVLLNDVINAEDKAEVLLEKEVNIDVLVTNSNDKDNQAKLPSAGENNSMYIAIIGLITMILSMFGVVIIRKVNKKL